MRTALLTYDYPPWPSGLSTAAREIAEGLTEAGADVTVFTLGHRRQETEGPIAILGCAPAPAGRLAALRRWGSVGHLAAPIAFRNAVLAEHRRRPFAVVEATNWYAPASALAFRAPMALVTRNSTPAAFSRDPATTLRDRLDQAAADRLERAQARASDGLISNTADHARRIAAEYGLAEGGQPDSVPHAIIGLSLPPEVIRRGREAAYPAGGAGLRLLFVGRAEHRKGFDALMAAMAILSAEADAGRLPPFELRLAGVDEAALPDDLCAAARRRLRPLGAVSDADLAAEYAGAHAVVAPSRYESFGLVYQEAIAYGRPIVASAEDASARAFVGDTGAGLLAAKTTGAALAEALRPVLLDPAVRARLRERAGLAAGRFTRQTLGQETLALYEAAIERYQQR
ncbi:MULTISPECIES: glycosyltransferase family 4 protein [unclassified Aureimonas]|uniref:glycosyltransferase family 4 protein n=1 Tax=unclassified Aureimonas TaxID=2615206 RepID=UPI0006FB417D|nr:MULTISPECIES: glycosyltransferase family 4 protein [unclassified Aureimonas]KQT68929.1 glycosyl transferase family 1 [Aureimonas sp. Leaf460]KQT69156.1 glycosyl transferase family 1 [Aureimonas sp. Leaf427]